MGARWKQAIQAAEKDTQTLFFEPRKDPDQMTRILVRVSYNHENDVQRYFRWTFLSPQDNIERWLKQETIKGKKFKYVSEVSVILGQPRVPPRTHSQICWDEHSEAIQAQLSFWKEWIFNLKVSHEDAKDNEKTLGKKPFPLDPFLAELQLENDATAQEFMDMAQYRANMPVHDRFSMNCDVINAPNFCHVCFTVAHLFAVCKARGCTICGSKDHPFYKCVKLCKCKARPPHTESKCPLKSARSTQPQEVVSLRRIQKEQKEMTMLEPFENTISETFPMEDNGFDWPIPVSNSPVNESDESLEFPESFLRPFRLRKK